MERFAVHPELVPQGSQWMDEWIRIRAEFALKIAVAPVKTVVKSYHFKQLQLVLSQ